MAAGADAVADDGFVVVVSIGSVAIFFFSQARSMFAGGLVTDVMELALRRLWL